MWSIYIHTVEIKNILGLNDYVNYWPVIFIYFPFALFISGICLIYFDWANAINIYVS